MPDAPDFSFTEEEATDVATITITRRGGESATFKVIILDGEEDSKSYIPEGPTAHTNSLEMLLCLAHLGTLIQHAQQTLMFARANGLDTDTLRARLIEMEGQMKAQEEAYAKTLAEAADSAPAAGISEPVNPT